MVKAPSYWKGLCIIVEVKRLIITIMTEEITAPYKDFEGIQKIDENGIEYWEARELMLLLGYAT